MTAIREQLLPLVPHRDKRDPHPGLLLQRYLQESATGDDGDPEQKQQLFAAAIQAAGNPEARAFYKAAFARLQKALLESAITSVLQTVDRLVIGLGTENVLETGIRLHHTYGTPILPGSALKGLAAHYCDQVWGDAEEQFRKGQSYHRLLFGTTDESGCLIFHDAWFVPDSETNPLQRDVMTPHHPQWLDGSAPPTDFDSPVPVPFLSIAGQFQIAVSWCGPTEKEWKWFWELGAACLRQALFDWGIGGKTTSGYGRFNEERWRITEDQRLKEAERKRIAAEKEATLAAMSPLERNIQELLENHPNKSEKREWPKLLEELKKSDGRFSTPEDRRAVAQRIKAGMQESGAWKDKGKDGERKKIIQNILGES